MQVKLVLTILAGYAFKGCYVKEKVVYFLASVSFKRNVVLAQNNFILGIDRI